MFELGAVHLDTVQMPTATHSNRCLEAFHCSSVVSGWWAIEPCPFERHSFELISALFCRWYQRAKPHQLSISLALRQVDMTSILL